MHLLVEILLSGTVMRMKSSSQLKAFIKVSVVIFLFVKKTIGIFISRSSCRLCFISGGYDQLIAVTTIEGEMLEKWEIGPLSSSLPSVNPPFVVCLTENKNDKRVFCGCGDGSIRCLSTVNGEHLANAVVNIHTGSISDVIVWWVVHV